MSAAPSPWRLDAGINVVLFAGLGGACDGIEAAGYPVHLAINHDEVAIAVHAARHPHTRHLQSDVFEVDPRAATGGRSVNILWASPDCRHHSRAKGGALVSARVRSLPWIVCRWLGQARPAILFVENVTELRGWGPLVAKRDKATGRVVKTDGTVAAKGERVPRREQFLVPDKKRQGRTYRRWVKHIERHDFMFEAVDLTCADYGVATTRKRLFGVGVRRDADAAAGAIDWPRPTHAPREVAAARGLKPWVPAASIIDWSLPLKSIFGRDRPLAEATLRRIARGTVRYVIEAKRPFIVPVTHGGDSRVHAIDEPLRTRTTAHRGEFAVIAPAIVGLAHGDSGGRREYAIDEPVKTLHAGGGNLALIAPLLVPRYGERAGQKPRARAVGEPLPTVVNTGNGATLVAAHLTKFRTGHAGADLAEPLPTYTANSYIKRPGGAPPLGVVGAFLERYRGRSAPGDTDAPIGTLSTHAHEAVAAAWLAQHNTGLVGHAADEPLSTIVARGSTQALAAVNLTSFYTSNTRGGEGDLGRPLKTFTAGGNHIGLVAAFLEKYYGEGGQHQAVDTPLDTVTAKPRFGLVAVEIAGVGYVVVDIGMRMLEPEEGAAAHGFKPGALPEFVTVNGIIRRLTKEQKMALVGNSVPPLMAELLVRANPVQALAAPRVTRAA